MSLWLEPLLPGNGAKFDRGRTRIKYKQLNAVLGKANLGRLPTSSDQTSVHNNETVTKRGGFLCFKQNDKRKQQFKLKLIELKRVVPLDSKASLLSLVTKNCP